MKLKNQILVLVAVAAGLSACSDENPWGLEKGSGGLSLQLTTDSSVTDARPRTRAEGFSAPAAEDFSVKLEKTDGSYAKTWPLLADFQNESSFATGTYTLTAFYGNIEDEGFDCPYFTGSAEVTVLEARQTEVAITASLANSMISIDYTDAFKKYFANYSATVHSEGHSYVEIPKDETRPAFVAPGNVDITIEFTKPNGQSAKVQPTSFVAAPKHNYHITFDVNGGNVGEAQMTINFDESIVQEDVQIDLTDELFSSKAPSIKPVGFANGEQLELLANTAPENPLKFTVLAYGGLQEATLTVASASYTPSFGKEINLIAATDQQQQQLANSGIKVLGLFKNPDKMASVDISGLIAKLPAGDYEISMMAKDRFTRVSDPVSVKFTSVPLTLEASAQSGLFGVSSAMIDVAYNGSNPKEEISFKAMNRNGVYVDAPVTKVEETTRTRSIATRNYAMTISLPDVERKQIPVKVYLMGKEVAQLNIELVEPEYTVDVDAFATRSVFRVHADENQKSVVTSSLKVYINGQNVQPSSRDLDQGLIYVNNLTPGTAYNDVKLSLSTDLSSAKEAPFTTEAATAVANGDFSKVNSGSIKFDEIQLGGLYHVGALNYSVYSSILRDEPAGNWANINSKTAWKNAACLNTWFTVPSTWVENGQAIVRSVGYNTNGTTPATSPGTSFNFSTTYYCTTVPTFGNNNRASGELFLGSYSFNGSDNRTDGIAFSSRPTSVSFDYSYTPFQNEVGLATVEVLNAAGTRIAYGTLDLSSASSMTKKTIPLTYAFGGKAATLRIAFRSTKGTSIGLNIPSGSALNEGTGIPASRKSTIGTNAYKTFAHGSELKLDNVTLNY
ncbi:MAG: DUF4493 domain-containing protein [Muribaculum sp.]|nr:DUF4493 domain-containing protein [Muribaculum sp.]